MIRYLFYQKNPASHYIYIDLFIPDAEPGKLQLQLPAWRPGRYELGNFSRNIKRVDVFNDKNEPVKYTKLNKDLWELHVTSKTSLKVTYSYYANEPNAGACYADDALLYVNPVHCCMSVAGREDQEHVVELQVPGSYRFASSMVREENKLLAENYEELVDSPFFASAKIESGEFTSNGISFHLHFCGECRPQWEKIVKDFQAFTDQCIEFWNGFPYNGYHFLFLVLPTKFYHGVEHKKNTVIALGPGYALNSGPVYEDLLGVSCHELFHVWNVKTIRPSEMMPYDYTKENYARTGYVYEGFTTYYGDKLLLSSGVFTLEQYFHTLEERLQKHFHNFGRYNLSVADSSWETWLDGYVPGAPYRKTSIYDEGCLVAFMLDVLIQKATANNRSLRDVCVLLFERFGKTGKGYTETDIVQLVGEVSGQDMSDFFTRYVYSPADYEEQLTNCFSYLGITMEKERSVHVSEHLFGFKTVDLPGSVRVGMVAPYSPGWKAGLFTGDEIVAVNDISVRNNFAQWMSYFQNDQEIRITVSSAERVKSVVLTPDKKGNTYFWIPSLHAAKANTEKTPFRKWASI